MNGLGAMHQVVYRLATMACSAGLFGLDTGHDKAKRISHALSVFGGLHKSFLQRLGGGRQTTWLSFFNLCHVAVSVTINWVAYRVSLAFTFFHQYEFCRFSRLFFNPTVKLISGRPAV